MLLPALGTFEYTPFLFDRHRCAKMEYGSARVVPPARLGRGRARLERGVPAWAGLPAWSGACPRGRGLPARSLVGLPAWEELPARSLAGIRNMVATPSLAIACPPRRACLHSRFPVSDFRFLSSDFQFPLAPALSTVNCLLSRLESAFIRIGPILPRKSFGMREPVEKVASIRVFKCFRVCALKMSAFVTYLECAFTKNPGGGTPCVQRWKIRE